MRDKAKVGRKLASRSDVHRIRRPVTPAGAQEFDLAYVRTGPRTDRPILILPGGPGMASLLPYRRLRSAAAARGLDVIMVEHRGIGLSRQDLEGVDLPPEALTVDQTAAFHVAHAVHAEAHRRLPGLADRIAALPRRGPTQLFGPLVTAAVATEEWLPRRFS